MNPERGGILPGDFPRVRPETVRRIVGDYFADKEKFVFETDALMREKDPEILEIILRGVEETGRFAGAFMAGAMLVWRALDAEAPALTPYTFDFEIRDTALAGVREMDERAKENRSLINLVKKAKAEIRNPLGSAAFGAGAMGVYELKRAAAEKTSKQRPN